MKHVWAGAVLLAVLLLAGSLLNAGMERRFGSYPRTLEQAAEASLTERWEQADALAENVRSQWEKSRKVTASVTDHALLEEVDCLFSELSVYRARRLGTEYAAVCADLARRIEEVVENQGLRWWHLL